MNENIKTKSNMLISYFKNLLSPYFMNIEFDISFHQLGTIFYIKELELKEDLLKKLGIPLNLDVKKITEIKLSINDLLSLGPMQLEIQGINIEVSSIYLSKYYQNDYINIKENILKNWQKVHQIFKKVKKEKNSFIENFILNCFSFLKISIKNLRIAIVENSEQNKDKKKIKKFEVKINEIISSYSLNNNQDNEDIQKSKKLLYDYNLKENITIINRIIKVEKFSLNIFNQTVDDYESMNVPDPFLQPINFDIKFIHNLEPDFKKNEQVNFININIEDPIILNISKEKIFFLTNLQKFFERTSKIKKYWIYRPENPKVNFNDYADWLKYAFKSVREEYRRKLKKYHNSYYFKDAINVERYSNCYKNFRVLEENNSNFKNDILKNIEKHMNVENILHAREYVFNELFKINKNDIENFNNINPYYEYKLNKWLTFNNLTNRIEEEILEEVNKSKILLNLINGNPNDTIIKFNLKMNLFIVNFNRKLQNNFENKEIEIVEQMKYYYEMFENNLIHDFNDIKKKFSNEKIHFLDWINYLENENNNNKNNHNCILESINEEIKFRQNNKNIQENLINNSLTKLGYQNQTINSDNSYSIYNENINKNETNLLNKNYNPSLSLNQEIINTNVENQNDNSSSDNEQKNNDYSEFFNKIKTSSFNYEGLFEEFSKKTLKKIIISIVITNISLDLTIKRNESFSLDTKVLSFNIIDHNFNYIISNINNANLLKNISQKKFFQENFNIIEYPFQSEEEALNGIIINYLLDTLNDEKIRSKILTENFLNEELHFLKEVEYNFKFLFYKMMKTNLNINYYYDIFCNVVFRFLFKKNIIENFIQLVIKNFPKNNNTNIKLLLTNDYSNFKSSFIMRLIDKFFSIHFNEINQIKDNKMKKSLEKNVIINDNLSINSEILLNNNSNNNNNIFNIQNKFYNFLIDQIKEDLILITKILIKNLIQYIFSPLICYFAFENKAYQHLYNNLNKYTQIVKKGYICKDNNYFINLNVKKNGINNINLNENNENKIEIDLKRVIDINLSNETLAELSIIIPSLKNNNNINSINCSGNIYDDLKMTYMDLYDNFLNLKNDFFQLFIDDNFNEENDNIDYENDYIIKKKDLIMNIKKNKLDINLSINNININIYDKIFFISSGMNSIISIEISDIIINNKVIDNFPINKIFNLKFNYSNFEPFDLLELLENFQIDINSIKVKIDKKINILETDLKINIIKSIWENIFFLPNVCLDINSNKIIISVSPTLIKSFNLIENLNKYRILYENKYKIKNKNKFNKSFNLKKKNKKTANINQIMGYINEIKKLLDYDESFFILKYYFIYRINNAIYYSIGNLNNNNNNINEIDNNIINNNNNNKFGIKLYFKLDKSKYNEYNDNLIDITIPLFFLVSKETLFYDEFEIWMSDLKIMNNEKERFINKLKISFPNENYNFTLFELLFCKNFINSINLYDKNKEIEIDFYEVKNIFKNSYNKSNNINRIIYKISYYYEITELKNIYNNIFNNNFKESTILLNIKKISLILLGKKKTKFINLLNDFIIYRNLFLNNIHDNNEFINTEINNLQNNSNDNSLLNNNNTNDSKNSEESQILNTNISYNKINEHKIDFSIGKITLIFKELNNKLLNDIGFIIYIKDIFCNENTDVKKINKKLAEIKISYIKIFISIPNFLKNKDNFENDEIIKKNNQIKLIDSNKMKKVLEKISKEKNYLFSLYIDTIVMNKNLNDNVSLFIQNELILGLIERPKKDISSKDNINFEEIIFKILNKNSIENMNPEEKNKLFEKINLKKEINLNFLNTNNFKTENCFELIIKNNFKESRRGITNDVLNPKQNEIFGQLLKMFKSIKNVFDDNNNYIAEINTGYIYISFLSTIFKYIYFIKNYIIDFEEKINNAFQKYIKNIKKENKNNKDEMKKEISIKDMKHIFNRTKSIRSNNTEKNRFSSPLDNELTMKIYKKSSLILLKKASSISKKYIKEKIPLIFYIPLISICFKQFEDNLLKPFIYIFLFDIEGELNMKKNEEDINLLIKINDAKILSEVRCENMLKCKNKDVPPIKLKVYLFREINDTFPKVDAEINNITFIFLFKILREILLFFEYNSACLDENPTKEEIDNLLVRKKIDQSLAEINLNNINLIIPEGSSSANYICIKAEKGRVLINKIDKSPKIILSPNKNEHPKIIDVKTIYNIFSIQTKEKEYIQHTKVLITAYNIKGFLCVNKKKNFLASIDQIRVLVTVPANDHELTMMRKILWKKKYKTNDTVIVKPSVSIQAIGGLKTNVGNLLSLKLFVDSNFDELSDLKSLNEKEANYSSMEFSFNIPELNLNMEMYKCYKDILDEKDVKRIKDKLPGRENNIDFDNLDENDNKKENEQENENEIKEEKDLLKEETIKKDSLKKIPSKKSSFIKFNINNQANNEKVKEDKKEEKENNIRHKKSSVDSNSILNKNKSILHFVSEENDSKNNE